MGAKGTVEVDFGSGGTHATVNVTGQTGILSGSLVEAWLMPIATADHSADEHIIAQHELRVVAGPPSAGIGFTIHALYQAPNEPLTAPAPSTFRSVAGTVYGGTEPSLGGRAKRVRGRFTIGWVWS